MPREGRSVRSQSIGIVFLVSVRMHTNHRILAHTVKCVKSNSKIFMVSMSRYSTDPPETRRVFVRRSVQKPEFYGVRRTRSVLTVRSNVIVERNVTCTRPRQGVYSNNISTQGILVLYWKKDSRRLVKNASREVQRNMKRMIIVVTAITAIAAIAITTISVPDRFE